jgi:hypothetical protein
MDYQNTVMGKNTELKLHGNYKMQESFHYDLWMQHKKNPRIPRKIDKKGFPWGLISC